MAGDSLPSEHVGRIIGCAKKEAPSTIMKSCARHLGFGSYSQELVYITSVLILIVSSVESSSFNDNFKILWGTVRLLNNDQIAELTMDQASGTIFHFSGHRKFFMY
jgi:hypothetical protein